MYAHCLFCNTALGRNESLEHFPVGRRLAFDPAKGRLWVVCRRCERWNLTPLEVRWEAIEEAESIFRQTRLRIATEHIGMAQLAEGLELVRVGAPPPLELAGWRYGDQFGRRRRRRMALTGIAAVAGTLPLLGPFGLGFGLAGGSVAMVHTLVDVIRTRRDKSVATLFIPDEAGTMLPLTVHDTWSATLVPIPQTRQWYLSVRHRQRNSPCGSSRSWPLAGSAQASEPAILKGDVALRALATLMPHANAAGATRRRIRDAVGVIENSPNVDNLIYAAAARESPSRISVSNPLTRLPAPVRLAMEMVLHEEHERLALEGELAALERWWREAAEIAHIADALLVPPLVEARLRRIQESTHS